MKAADSKNAGKSVVLDAKVKPIAATNAVSGSKGELKADPKIDAKGKGDASVLPVVVKQKRVGFDPDAKYSFEEENERDDAIRKIQRSYRVHRARTMLRMLIRNNYVKLYDRESDMYFYKNKTTGETSQTKPACLGSDDLDMPKQLKAPDDYDVGYIEGMPEGWFLGVFCRTFPRSGGRLKDMDFKKSTEMEALADLMPHDFICRFKPENVTILDDPRCGEVLDCIERLGRICTKKGFFVMYICTHVVTVVKGEPKTNPKETAYFATKETVWTTRPTEIATSAISLTDLCRQINKLPCRRKSIIVDYAHMPEPKRSVVAANRFLYPPSDFLPRLADSANCAVIASCVAGVSMTDTLCHTASLAQNKPVVKKAEKVGRKDAAKDREDAQKDGESSGHESEPSDAEEKYQESAHSDNSDDEAQVAPVTQHEDSAEEFLRMLDGTDHSHDYKPHGILHFLKSKFNTKKETAKAWTRMMDRFIEEWKVPPEAEIVQTPKPPPLRANWSKNPETGDFDVTLPTDQEKLDYKYNLALWKIKRTFGPPVNYLREKFRALKKRVMYGPCQAQLSASGENMTLFGSALMGGLRGGAHELEKRTVSVKMIFDFIDEKMKAECKKLYLAAVNQALADAEAAAKQANDERKYPDKEPEILVDKAAVKASVNPADYNQNPLLFVPKHNARAAKNPICIRCGPPAAPEKPFVVRTTTNEAVLEWYSPEFDGVPPWKYQIEMRNKSRVFNQWKPINYKPEIKTTRFRVRNLPSGVPCQFRVSAFNNGGWSKDSPETGNVIPGEELTPLQTAGRWRKICLSGPLGILDHLKFQLRNRLEQIIGLTRLSGFAQKASGFQKGTIQLKAAAAAFAAMEIFINDQEIIRPAFMLIGWTLNGGPATDAVRTYLEQIDIRAWIVRYMERFRHDSTIINASAFIRKGMPAGAIPQPPAIVPPPDHFGKEKNSDSDDLDSDTDDEERRKEEEEEAKKPKHNLNKLQSAIGSFLYYNAGRQPDNYTTANEAVRK